MRALKIPPGSHVILCKKDARHFFHALGIGAKWAKYTAHPPILGRSGALDAVYPCHLATPMGFTASASWAQAFNEVVARRSELPVPSRLIDDKAPPATLPIWASILDDFWTLEVDSPQRWGETLLSRIGTEWAGFGLDTNTKKDVLNASTGEVQGAFVHGTDLWLGVSMGKRTHLLQAGLHIISRPWARLRLMERFVGKVSFALGFKSCARSVFQEVYVWIQACRCRGAVGLYLWPAVRAEIFAVCALVPMLEIDLAAPFAPRVETSDASPGGHGRAWATWSDHDVHEACRLVEGRGWYTNLGSQFCVTDEDERTCAAQQLRFDPSLWSWKKAGRPGGYAHINLEEANALVWSAHDRLRRADEQSVKALHIVDSTAVAGAAKKGRSASRLLNARMRQLCAVCIAGGLELFIAWCASGLNPSDDPSSWFGIRSGKSSSWSAAFRPALPIPCLRSASTSRPWLRSTSALSSVADILAAAVLDFDGGVGKLNSILSEFPVDTIFAIHLCSGPARGGDFAEQLVGHAAAQNLNLVVLSIDPLLHPLLDLLRDAIFHTVMHIITSRKHVIALAGPPCSTWSRARHHRLAGGGGPRPLRHRFRPWHCLSHRTSAEVRAVELGSALALRCLWLLWAAAVRHHWILLEHPADAGHPVPSLFFTSEAQVLLAASDFICTFVQCAYGAPAVKPTTIITTDSSLVSTLQSHAQCMHPRGHRPAIGLRSRGGFKTTSLSAYPTAFSSVLAAAAVDYALRHRWRDRPQARDLPDRPEWAPSVFAAVHLEGPELEDLHRGARKPQN